ncbi:MAG: hypothetical protein JXX28_13195 [Deltaproteobacteria bacterium]|nr:hypothetical protein [Deltaproteobacteria bacterium]
MAARPVWVRRALWIAGGAAFGFGWWALIGCTGGSCPITGNPYLSTIWGTSLGAMVGWNR